MSWYLERKKNKIQKPRSLRACCYPVTTSVNFCVTFLFAGGQNGVALLRGVPRPRGRLGHTHRRGLRREHLRQARQPRGLLPAARRRDRAARSWQDAQPPRPRQGLIQVDRQSVLFYFNIIYVWSYLPYNR